MEDGGLAPSPAVDGADSRDRRRAPSTQTEWPAADTEPVPECPACGSAERTAGYAGLHDKAFGVAPGRWNSCRCGSCGCLYLDPRPTEATVHRAYSAYYTHRAPEIPFAPTQGARRRERRRAELSRLHERWGYPIDGAEVARGSALGTARELALDRSIRHMPWRRDGRLLDVGCGNGTYLLRMRHLGWTCTGVETDGASAAIARSAGLRVLETPLPRIGLAAGAMDAVTMDHVIEHLHAPVEYVRHCWRLLAPGGRLWIATPNVESLGHRRFGADWFALQPPSHIALHTRRSIVQLLGRAGIEGDLEFQTTQESGWMFEASACVRLGLDPLRTRSLPGWRRRVERVRAKFADARGLRRPEHGEEIVVVVAKPSAAN